MIGEVGVGVSVLGGVAVVVGVNVRVGVHVSMGVALIVGVIVSVGVAVRVDDTVVIVGVIVTVGVAVKVGVMVIVRVMVGVTVRVSVAVRVEVLVGVNVAVRVGVYVFVLAGGCVGVYVFGTKVADGKMIQGVLVAVTCAVAVTCGEAAGVDVFATGGLLEGFGVALGLFAPFVGVFCGVRKISCQDGGVRIAGKTGSITTVLLSEIYCALGSNFESILAWTVHCGARPIASVPVNNMQTSPSKTIAGNKIQSRFRRS